MGNFSVNGNKLIDFHFNRIDNFALEIFIENDSVRYKFKFIDINNIEELNWIEEYLSTLLNNAKINDNICVDFTHDKRKGQIYISVSENRQEISFKAFQGLLLNDELKWV